MMDLSQFGLRAKPLVFERGKGRGYAMQGVLKADSIIGPCYILTREHGTAFICHFPGYQGPHRDNEEKAMEDAQAYYSQRVGSAVEKND